MTFIPVEYPLVGLGPLTLQARPLEILILPPNTFTIFLLCVTHKSHPKATHVSFGHLPGQTGLSSAPGSGHVLQRQRPPWETHSRVWWRTQKQHLHYREACGFCGNPVGLGVGKASRGDLEQVLVRRSPAGRKGILGESTANAKTRRQGSECRVQGSARSAGRLVRVAGYREALSGWEKWAQENISVLGISQGPAESGEPSVFNVNTTCAITAVALIGTQHSFRGLPHEISPYQCSSAGGSL